MRFLRMLPDPIINLGEKSKLLDDFGDRPSVLRLELKSVRVLPSYSRAQHGWFVNPMCEEIGKNMLEVFSLLPISLSKLASNYDCVLVLRYPNSCDDLLDWIGCWRSRRTRVLLHRHSFSHAAMHFLVESIG